MKLLRPKTRLESFLEKFEFYWGFNPLKVACLSIAFVSLFVVAAFTAFVMLDLAMEIRLENNL